MTGVYVRATRAIRATRATASIVRSIGRVSRGILELSQDGNRRARIVQLQLSKGVKKIAKKYAIVCSRGAVTTAEGYS